MGTDYRKRLRERGLIVVTEARSPGAKAWHLWLEMDLRQRTVFCRTHGLTGVKPPEFKVLDGVGPDCMRRFGMLWCKLTGKQQRAFCARAGLVPVQPAELVGDQADGTQADGAQAHVEGPPTA